MTEVKAVLACRGLSKSYVEGPRRLPVLRDVGLAVMPGETLAITGQSGSGKTTLLNMLGGLDKPDEGEVLVDGRSIAAMSELERCRLRNRALGFVYQFHHLLMEFSAVENVAMPLLIGGFRRAEALSRAAQMLEQTGLGARLDHRPSELSGGERQRVAIARALVANPRCVLMDEPTGNLDRDTALTIRALLMQLNRDLGCSLVIVTHDLEVAASLSRHISLTDGRISDA